MDSEDGEEQEEHAEEGEEQDYEIELGSILDERPPPPPA